MIDTQAIFETARKKLLQEIAERYRAEREERQKENTPTQYPTTPVIDLEQDTIPDIAVLLYKNAKAIAER